MKRFWKNHRKINGNFFWFPLIFVFYACGTQDYKKEGKELEVVGTSSWKELALLARNKNTQILGNCEKETLCLRAPYIGPVQLAQLVVDEPGVLSADGSSDNLIYKIEGSPKLQIEVDILEIPEGSTLQFCGEKLIISASEILGEGFISTSGEGCENQKNAGDIFVAAKTITGVHFQANGRNGSDGKDGILNFNKKAKDGDPNALKILITTVKEPINFCLDPFACLPEVQKKLPGKDIHENLAFIDKYIAEEKFPRLEFGGVLNDAVEDRLEAAKQVVKESANKGGIWVPRCYLKSDPGKNNGETGLIQKWDASLSGVNGLNGEDASAFSLGEAGEITGKPGQIEIIASTIKIPKVEVKLGKGGKAGKSFYQEPGSGVSPASTSIKHSERFFGWVECEANKDELFFKSPIDIEVSKTFTIGESYLETFKGLPKILGFGLELNGKDGKPLNILPPEDVSINLEIKPQIIPAPISSLIKTRLLEACSTCAVPKALEGK